MCSLGSRLVRTCRYSSVVERPHGKGQTGVRFPFSAPININQMIVHGKLRLYDMPKHPELLGDPDENWLYHYLGEQGKWEQVQASNSYDADDKRYLELTTFEIPDAFGRTALQGLIENGLFIPF